MDEFSLAPDPLVSPLDIGQFGGTPPLQPPRPGAPQMPSMGQRGGGMQEAAPLLMLLPLIAKGGGRSAIAAFLRGMQKSRATQMNEQRATNQDRRADAQQESLDAHRRALEEQAQLRNQQQFRTQFATGLQGLEDDEAIRAYLDLMGPQGEKLGISRGDLDAFAMQTQKPSTLQKRAAEKRIAALKGQFGQDKWMQEGAKFLHEVGGERVPFEELLRRAGMVPDPQAPLATPGVWEGNTPEKLHIAAFARERGKAPEQLTSAELREARRSFQTVDDRPPDPVLAQVRQLQLAMLQRNQGSMTPAQFSMAQQLANDYTAQSKEYLTRLAAFDSIKAAAKDPSAAGDLALIFSYMRMLDPGSTVREGEFANAQNSAGIPDQIRNLYNRAVSGERLNPRQRADFVRQARAQFQQAKARQRGIINVFTTRARRASLNPEDVVIDYDQVFGVTDDLPDVPEMAPSHDAGTPRSNPFRPPQR